MMTLNPEIENMTLNIKLKTNDGFESQNWECALNAETENATLNVKLRSDGSERRNWEAMMALNVEIENEMRMALNADTEKWWLWMPKLRSGDGSKCRN